MLTVAILSEVTSGLTSFSMSLSRWIVFLVSDISAQKASLVLDCASHAGALGLENGDFQVFASSFSENYLSRYGRLNFDEDGIYGGWLHSSSDNDPWFAVNFVKDALISGVATQGGVRDRTAWMEKFEMSYTVDGTNFAFYKFATKTKVQ